MSWESRPVNVILETATVNRMRARARQFHVQRGGRFDVLASMILIWTGALDKRAGESDIIGGFHIQPNTPAGGLATICQLEWNPEDGGSEEMLWRAVELLSGRFIRC